MPSDPPSDPPKDPLLDDPLADPLLEEHVERALAPYRGAYPPEVLAACADELRIFFTTHPVAERMLSRIREHPTRVVSGNEAKAGATALGTVVPGKGKVGS
jgi:hypothetical protein